jgi:hypothetical protein
MIVLCGAVVPLRVSVRAGTLFFAALVSKLDSDGEGGQLLSGGQCATSLSQHQSFPYSWVAGLPSSDGRASSAM